MMKMSRNVTSAPSLCECFLRCIRAQTFRRSGENVTDTVRGPLIAIATSPGDLKHFFFKGELRLWFGRL